MINADSLAAVAAARGPHGGVHPLYDTYGFAQLPRLITATLAGATADPTVTRLLGPLAGRYDKVIFFFVDAFGWQFFAPHAESDPFLAESVREGYLSQLTAQFPSTTAAHTTTIHTGLPVGTSGVYEWYYYEPQVDAMIAPLLFSFAGDKARNTLAGRVAPAALFPTATLYQALAAQGVRSYIFQHQSYTPSPFSDTVFAGADVRPYANLAGALDSLVDVLLTETSPSYYFLYFDRIDAAGHQHGPQSPQFQAEIAAFLGTMTTRFHRPLRGKLKNALFLLSADHGQMAISPQETIYLNRLLPDFARFVKTNRQGQLLIPAGSCRDMFLHIKEDRLDEAQAVLEAALAGRARVCRVADLVAQGYFGPGAPSAAFLGRVGDLVVLPEDGQAVWWYETDRFVQAFYGNHGGLSPAEMEIPLLARAYT